MSIYVNIMIDHMHKYINILRRIQKFKNIASINIYACFNIHKSLPNDSKTFLMGFIKIMGL